MISDKYEGICFLESNPPGPRPGSEPKSNFYGKFDVETGFSPSFAEAADVTKRVQWKAKAFHYIDCTNLDKLIRN